MNPERLAVSPSTMRVHILRLELDEKPTERDRKVIEAAMRLTEKRLSNGHMPSFYLATVRANKIKRTTD